MSEVEYWSKQILMYWGFPNDYFTQTEIERSKINEKINFRVLHLAQETSLLEIFKNLLYLPNRWTEEQWRDIEYLLNQFIGQIETDKMTFKENLIRVVIVCLNKDLPIQINSATDVLRLAVGLSDGDISLAQLSKFRSFKRSERRYLLNLLNKTSHLEQDFYRHKNI